MLDHETLPVAHMESSKVVRRHIVHHFAECGLPGSGLLPADLQGRDQVLMTEVLPAPRIVLDPHLERERVYRESKWVHTHRFEIRRYTKHKMLQSRTCNHQTLRSV